MKAMRSRFAMAVAGLAISMLACGTAAFGQGIEDQGRAVLEKNQQAVVTIQLVVKMKLSMEGMGSQEQESKEEATGFVIDPTGLIVLPLSVADPSSMIDSMMSSRGASSNQLKIDTSLADVKALFADGKEMATQVVLRDKDLDLAFMRTTEKPAQPLPFIDLSQAGTAKVLDQVVALGRMGKVLNRTSSASLERIEAIVNKPRTLYVPGNAPTNSGMGSPVFTVDGKALGMIVMRAFKDDTEGGLMDMMQGGGRGMVAVVLPASDILDAAKQAPAEAPKEEPAAETPQETPKEEPADGAVIIPNEGAAPAQPGV